MAFTPACAEALQPKVTEARKQIWNAINAYVHSRGGHVVSVPFGRFVRVEVEQGSDLPTKLERAGYDLHHAGMTTRIDGGKFHTVDVLELDLGR